MGVQALGIMLVLVNVLTIVGPVAGVALVYQDRWSELVVPPQISQMLTETSTMSQQTPLAQIIDARVDNESQCFIFTVNFTNPLNYSLALKVFSADVQCVLHEYSLGQVSNNSTEAILPAGTTQLTISGSWTMDGENHFAAEHLGEYTIDVRLTNVLINFNDITIELKEPIEIPNVPIT